MDNKKRLGIERIGLLWQAAKAAQDGNHRAAAHYTQRARYLALLAGYRATYGNPR